MSYQLLLGDCVEVLKTLPANSVQCCVTSPPYYGLRDYLTATWEGGDPECDHRKVQDTDKAIATSTLGGGKATTGHLQEGYGATCKRCGARRIDHQIGLEETPELFVAKLVEVFREVRRVLRDDGVLWLNLGDSYNGSGGSTTTTNFGKPYDGKTGSFTAQPRHLPELKPKDLIGIPWMTAFALRADGWYLRSEVIWHKKAPMPESVTDRPTKAHEQLFLLAKSRDYFYGADAIAEPTDGNSGWEKQRRSGNGFPIGGRHPNESLLRNDIGRTGEPSTHRNKRSV